MKKYLAAYIVMAENIVEKIVIHNSCKNNTQECKGKNKNKQAVNCLYQIISAEVDSSQKKDTLSNEIMSNYQKHVAGKRGK